MAGVPRGGYTMGSQSGGAADDGGGGGGESRNQADADAEADGDEISLSETAIEATRAAGGGGASSDDDDDDAGADSLQGTYDRGVAIFSPELVLHAQEVWNRLAPQVHAMHSGSEKESIGKAGKAMSGVYAVVLSAQVCDRRVTGDGRRGGGMGSPTSTDYNHPQREVYLPAVPKTHRHVPPTGGDRASMCTAVRRREYVSREASYTREGTASERKHERAEELEKQVSTFTCT